MCRILNICYRFLQASQLKKPKQIFEIRQVQIDELPRTLMIILVNLYLGFKKSFIQIIYGKLRKKTQPYTTWKSTYKSIEIFPCRWILNK